MSDAPRRAYSYRTAAADYSVSVTTLRRAVAAGKVRARCVGRAVRLHPEDLEREFGFGAPPAEYDPVAAQIASSILEALEG